MVLTTGSATGEAGRPLARLTVRDEGIGIAEQDLPHIFDRFYRTRDASRYRGAGLGIGLYLSSEIVRRHGGRLWAESRLGEGSSFHLDLPCA